MFDLLKTVLERSGYHKSQVDPCVFYRKYSFILTYASDFVIVSHKQETITSLIELLNNGPENYVLSDEGGISNYLVVNIKNISGETFKLSQSNLVEKSINRIGLIVYVSLKAI